MPKPIDDHGRTITHHDGAFHFSFTFEARTRSGIRPVTDPRPIDRVGGVVGLLEVAEAHARREFYLGLGLNPAYRRLDGREMVRATLEVEFSGVGGGTRNFGPRPVVVDSGWSELR